MSQDKPLINALNNLGLQDEDIAKGITDYGYPSDRSMPQSFGTLAKIIIGQQISRQVATSLWAKLTGANLTSAKALVTAAPDMLKAHGVSQRKAEYLIGLAQAIETGALDLGQLPHLSGQEVQDRLTALRGIGAWTADNYRLFALGDMDAWPGNDIALQEAMRRLKRLNSRPDMAQMEILAAHWSPYRGAGALFLWHLYAIEVRHATPSAI